MRFGSSLPGRLFTRTEKWSIRTVNRGHEFKLKVGGCVYRFQIDGLRSIQVTPGAMWSTCRLAVARRTISGPSVTPDKANAGLAPTIDPSGVYATALDAVDTFEVDGIPNAMADAMRVQLHAEVAGRLAGTIASSAKALDAWLARAQEALDAGAAPSGHPIEIRSALLQSGPPSPPPGLSWWSAFTHPLLSEAHKQARQWPAFNGSPQWALAIGEWSRRTGALLARTGWIPKGAVRELVASLPEMRDQDLQAADADLGKRLIARFIAQLEQRNDAYLVHQASSCATFFRQVEKNPLTEEQIKACVCMDDHVLVVAAAGAGKTSTMVAKTGYVLQQHLAEPNQILLLAFNHDAALELRRRVDTQLRYLPSSDDYLHVSYIDEPAPGEINLNGLGGMFDLAQVRIRTFHAFGLDVIGAATGKKPTLAPWVETGRDLAKVAQIIHSLADVDPVFRHQWDLFRSVYARPVGRFGARPDPDAYANGVRGLRTARNEIVKSQEERQIADWLFFHGVNYEYERSYEYPTADETHRQYYPDFYYPDIGLYHEHFALDAEGHAPDWFGGDYEGDAEWKRQLHRERSTELFETTSHGLRSAQDLGRLEQELRRRGVTLNFDPDRETPGEPAVPERALVRTFRVFQQHAKSNALTPDQLKAALVREAENELGPRLTLFLALYERIAAQWEHDLRTGGYVDFDDMMLQATEHIRSGRYVSPFTVILADEFQDSSRARIGLLHALAHAAPQRAHVCAVGDDWQGINRFAGSDISVMTEFEKTFQPATRLLLSTTFRCPQSLCDMSSRFVQANPAQIRKQVATANPQPGPAVECTSLENPADMSAFVAEQLGELVRNTAGDTPVTVLLLGRYRNDQPSELAAWQRRYAGRLQVEFKTVHASKGLEADYVFVLNVVAGTRGFPSRIEDDPALQMAMPTPEEFPFAEERRLFYVALTRARHRVHLQTLDGSPSSFLVQLAHQGELQIVSKSGNPVEACPKCLLGVLKLRRGRAGAFWGCSRFPACNYTRDADAPTETLNRAPGRPRLLAGSVRQGDPCPACGSGQMRRRTGRYGPFLGCSNYPRCRITAPAVPLAE